MKGQYYRRSTKSIKKSYLIILSILFTNVQIRIAITIPTYTYLILRHNIREDDIKIKDALRLHYLSDFVETEKYF